MKLNIVPHPLPDVAAGDVLQVRHIIKRLELPEDYGAETTIQINRRAYYSTDEPTSVAAAVNQERQAANLPPLAELILPGGKPVWFAGEKAQGPVRLIAGEMVDGIHSAFYVGDLLTRVRSSPVEVAAAIQASGGHVLPIPEMLLV